VINLLAYFVSIVLKTKKIFEALESLVYIVYYIFSFLFGIALLLFGISLLLGGHFLWLIIYFFVGIGIIGFLFNLLQMPFIFLTAYFSNKIQEKDFEENITTAEVIGEKGKVIKKIESDTIISVRLAKYFLLLYLINFASVFLRPEYHAGWRWGDYILWPFLWLVSESLVIGILYVIYHRIRHGLFFPEDRRCFFIQVWKMCFIILLFFSMIAIIITKNIKNDTESENLAANADSNQQVAREIKEKDEAIQKLEEKANAYSEMIELHIEKAETLKKQIDLINQELSRGDLSKQDRASLLKQKESILAETRSQEAKYQELLERIEEQKQYLLKDISTQNQSLDLENINRYGGEIMQIGGVGSRLTQKTAYLLTEQGYLSPAEDWVFSSFNTPADIMDVDCREGYKISSCKLDDKKQKLDDTFGCRIMVKDEINNRVNIECIKK